MLVKYIRDKNNNPRGCVLSFGRGMLSWSLCSEEDKFSKKEAKRIAIERFYSNYDEDGVQLLDAEYWRSCMLDRVLCFQGNLKNINTFHFEIIQTLFEQEERSYKYFKEEV